MKSKRVTLLPRFIRYRDAPAYLGMDRHRFDQEIRPYLTLIRMGKQAIAFCRLEVEDVAAQYMERNGCPGRLFGEELWDTEQRQASSARRTASGISTNGSTGEGFAKALERLNS